MQEEIFRPNSEVVGRVASALDEMRAWLVWRFGDPRPNGKRLKIPFYASGAPREGAQGSAADRAALVTFDEALRAARVGGFSGVGFALHADQNIVALDFDNCVHDGVIDPRVAALVQGTYAEFSPSGKGVRAFMRGSLASRKDLKGAFPIEYFGDSGYVTFTGNAIHDLPISDITPAVIADYTARFGAVHPAAAHDADDLDALMGLEPKAGISLEFARSEILSRCDPGASNDEWVKSGMAMHHEFDGSAEALDAWDAWSATAENYGGRTDVEARWRSFGRRRSRPFTMEALARSVGVDLAAMVASLEPDAYSTILASIATQRAQAIEGQTLAADALCQVAAASLSASQEASALQAIKVASGLPIAALRKDLAALRSASKSESEEGTHHRYALSLLAKLARDAGGHEPVGADGVFYVLDGRSVWAARTIEEITARVAREFDGRDNCRRRGDYKAIAEHAYGLCEQPEFFEAAPVGLACPDGFHRVTSDGAVVREPLSADHRQRHMHGASPCPGPMPTFERYLADTFAAASAAESRSQVEYVQEVAGAVALGLMAAHERVSLFYGPGRSGKSTLIKVLEAMVPPESRASVSPFHWDREYYLAALAGKRLNVVGELPDDLPLPGSYFKQVTGRDLLSGRQPSHRVFTFRNEAAHVFNSNTFPNTRDHSEAFFTRWLIVGFLNSRIDRGTIETDLAERMVDLELPAILAWALQGARRLVQRGHFEPTSTHRRLLAQWRRRTDSVMEFLHDPDACSVSPLFDWACRRSDLYLRYRDWCRESGRKELGKQKFNEALDAPAIAALGISVKRSANMREVVFGVRIAEPVDFHCDGNDGF